MYYYFHKSSINYFFVKLYLNFTFSSKLITLFIYHVKRYRLDITLDLEIYRLKITIETKIIFVV